MAMSEPHDLPPFRPALERPARQVRGPHHPSRLLVALVMVLGLLLGFLLYREVFDRGKILVEPRTVTARGDLAEDEKATTELFRSASPSVVFITTIRKTATGINRGILETRDVREGTGSGFI